MDMIERLLSGTNMTEMDPFTIQVLLKLARAEEKVKIAHQEVLTAQILTAQQEVLTAQQEVKTLGAEKALLARDLQKIFVWKRTRSGDKLQGK